MKGKGQTMARDILSEYGDDVPKKAAGRAKSGGVKTAKSLPYSTPQGPTSLGNRGPGLGGDNYGACGVQGPKAARPREGGGVGLGGENRGKGVNRRG